MDALIMLSGAYGDPPEPEKEPRGWLRDHFSVNCWCSCIAPLGDFTVIRADLDWSTGEEGAPCVALTLGLIGLHVCVTYWPEGKG